MKKILFALLYISVNSVAQTNLDFSKSNFEGQGTIFLSEKDSVSGMLFFDFQESDRVLLQLPSSRKTKTYRADSVIKFEMTGIKKTFIRDTVKKIKGYGFCFYEWVNPENIKFMILSEFSTTGKIAGGAVQGQQNYFIHLPGKQKRISINDMKLDPFKKKIPIIINDCPELAQKIINEEPGYKINMLAQPKAKLDVYLKISAEYLKCK